MELTDDDSASPLVVRLHGRRIGAVRSKAGGRSVFAFEQAYIEDDARPTLSLSVKRRSGRLVQSRMHKALLPPFFANLLPEGRMRDYLAWKAGLRPRDHFQLLAALGGNLYGAVQVHAQEEEDENARKGGPGDREQAGAMRFALSGMQPKFVAAMESGGGMRVSADGDWIVKLPERQYPFVPENEFAMLALARSVGIEAPRAELVPVGAIAGLPDDFGAPDEFGAAGGNALAVQRFDRLPGGGRVHAEEFAQLFGVPPSGKYDARDNDDIAAVLAAEIGPAAVGEFVRRLAFSIATGNADMHLKNWSLLYPDGCRPVLAPAYDYPSTAPYPLDRSLALGFGGESRIDDVSPEQVRRLAQKAGLDAAPLWREVQRITGQAADAWRGLAERNALPIDILEPISSHIEMVAANVARR